jgi:hypothetical protein
MSKAKAKEQPQQQAVEEEEIGGPMPISKLVVRNSKKLINVPNYVVRVLVASVKVTAKNWLNTDFTRLNLLLSRQKKP